jgi:hypothetical protein
MAVGAQQPQVLGPVVAPVPADVIDLECHRPAEPLGWGAASGASLGYTDFPERSPQLTGPGPPFTAALDQQVFRSFQRCRSRLSAQMTLAEEV